jgi:hypothetical protein
MGYTDKVIIKRKGGNTEQVEIQSR